MPRGNPRSEHAPILDVASFVLRINGWYQDPVFAPGGKLNGREYVVRNPKRNDRHAGSFSINVDTGAWADFATGDSGGDPVSLYAYLHDMNNGQAADKLAQYFHIPTSSAWTKPDGRGKSDKTKQPDTGGAAVMPEGLIMPVPDNAPRPPSNLYHGKDEYGKGDYRKIDHYAAYRDAEGRLLCYVGRSEQREGMSKKLIKPLTLWREPDGSMKWYERWKKHGDDDGLPRPLYGLELLAQHPDARVLVVEGEKKCDAARQALELYGWVVVSLFGGSAGVRKMDLSPLKGRECVCWPDHDKLDDGGALKPIAQRPGYKAMKYVADTVGASLMTIPEIYPDKWDVGDALIPNADYSFHPKDLSEFIDRCLEPVKPPVKEVSLDGTVTAHEELTDMGDALRLYRLYGKDIRFIPDIDAYVLWTGDRWEIQPYVTKVMRFTKSLPVDLREEAQSMLPKDTPPEQYTKDQAQLFESYEKHAKKVQAYNTIRAVLSILKSEERIEMSQHRFDTNPWLLNCANGTIKLEDMTHHKHHRGDFITKRIDVAYDLSAKCSLWESTLKRFLPDDELRSYFQRAIGYSMTGDMRERCFFIAYGKGKNGKSTIIDTIRSILGEYGAQADKGVFFERKIESDISNGLARLRSCRFVSSSEPKEGALLAVELIKQITGGDKIAARFLHQEFFEFQPAMKIWLATNHRPRITDTNRAIWDRLQLIPFIVTISDDEVDDTVRDRLVAEYPGILNWMIQGYMKWRAMGLKPPQMVLDATREYRGLEDPVRGFLNDCYVFVAYGRTQAEPLYQSYKMWCFENIIEPLSVRVFSKRLVDDIGLAKRKNSKGTHEYLGIQHKDQGGHQVDIEQATQ